MADGSRPPKDLAEPLPPADASLGHNGGPPLDEEPPKPSPADWNYFCWKKAHEAAFAPPSRFVMMLRLRRAQEMGITYKEYVALMLDGRLPR